MHTALLVGLLLAAKPAAKDDPDVVQARKMFQWGQKLYKQARYTEAIAKFEEAYRLKPHPVVYFNIGRCYEQLGEIPKALRYYRDYLRISPDASDRETVADAIVNLERRLKEQGVQQLMVYADPPEAKISVDDKELGTSPASVELPPGNHRLTVKLDGYETVARSLVMPAQKSLEISVTLRPGKKKDETPEIAPPPPPVVAVAPPPPPPVDTTPQKPPEVTAPEPAPQRPGRGLVYAAAGVAGAGLAGGVAMGLMSNSAAAELAGGVHPKDEAQALYNRATGMAMGANVSYGVAAAAAVTAAVLFFLEPKQPSVTSGGAGSGGATFTF